MRNRIILFFILALIINIGCSEESGTNSNEPPPETISEQALLAALWLTNEFTPPRGVAEQIENDLTQLRDKYADSLSVFNLSFIFPVDPQALSIGLTDETKAAVRAGSYGAWNPHNDDFNVVEIDTTFIKYGWVTLRFEDLINPFKIAPYYSVLQGITYVEPIEIPGDHPNYYPWYIDDEIVYLFREAWGDCPAGCIYSHFWYVKKIDDEFEIVGDFEADYQTPAPDWWEEISEAYYSYRHLFFY